MKLNEGTGLDIGAPQERRPTLETGTGHTQRRSPTAAPAEGGARGVRRPSCMGGPRSQTIIFDVETGPLSEAELAAALPPFDPNEVKVGNIKDPEISRRSLPRRRPIIGGTSSSGRRSMP